MSDFNGFREDGTADKAAKEPAAAASVAGHSTAASPVNPRKRKKSSRAPQKKRGPAQGYRSALHTLRESAAAWGAALNLIPSLGPVVEGYLKQPEGKRLIQVIKDPAQQEFFIQAWQQSGVFKTFFGDEASDENPSATPDGEPTSVLTEPTTLSIPQLPDSSNQGNIPPDPGSVISPLPLPVSQLSQAPQVDTMAMTRFETGNHFNFGQSPSTSSQDGNSKPRQSSTTGRPKQRTESISFSDIVARDAARSSHGFSQTLGSLGFAPNETLEDFLDLSFNPEPIDQPPEQDTVLGSDDDQKAYYELLMGRRFG